MPCFTCFTEKLRGSVLFCAKLFNFTNSPFYGFFYLCFAKVGGGSA